jgi:hypothetical protein
VPRAKVTAGKIYFVLRSKNVLTLKFFIGINAPTASIWVANIANIEVVQVVHVQS